MAKPEPKKSRTDRARDVALYRYSLIRPLADPNLSATERGRLVRDMAAQVHIGPFGQPTEVSRASLDRWIRAWRAGGFDALLPAQRQITPRTDAEVLELAARLKAEHPARTAAHIARIVEAEQGWAPSARTLQRHFARLELNTRPDGNPPAAFGRFEATEPDEMWISDGLHGPIIDGKRAVLFALLDDHSRYLLDCQAFPRVTGDHVVSTFLTLTDEHGTPASTLTDNGVVYTARFVGGQNAFEHVLALLGVTQKNGSPGHPQTQGKIERFHQTLKRWLQQQPAATTLAELQHQLDRFRTEYNEQRPHRSLARTTPAHAYQDTPKALPAGTSAGIYRIRYDRVSRDGKLTLRRAGRLHHLGVGIAQQRKRVLLLIDTQEVTVVHIETGEVIAINRIDPDRNYWRNTQRQPGRWPGSRL